MHFKTETVVGLFILAATVLFFYMSFQLGSLRLDSSRYAYYTICFKDVAGLAQKAEVRIAGVKVGWVDSVELVPDDMQVRLGLKIFKDYNLRSDMQALVRQEGMLGAKFLEIMPGVDGAIIPQGSALPFQKRQFVSIDELFYSFQKIALTVENLGETSHALATQAQEFLTDMKKSLTIVNNLLMKFNGSADNCTEQFATTAQALKNAALDVSRTLESAQEPLKHVGDLAQKIQQGQGSLGKILNDTQVYDDVKYTAQLAKGCLERIQGCAAAIDTHLEILPQRQRTDIKGYFDIWLYPHPRYFCLVGPVYSRLGFARHARECFASTSSGCGDSHCSSLASADTLIKRGKAHGLDFLEQKRDNFRLNLQVGALLPWQFAVRGGLFQGTAGVGIDWMLPFDCVRWVSTFEAFDFGGNTRFDSHDHRPYLKWINRLFFSNNAYLAFGANDFISKRYKSGFIGVGVFFSTGDLWPCRQR